MITIHIMLVLIGWMVAAGSPGPATLAISGTSMEQGRRAGIILTAGIMCGSATWGIAAALGMSAVMLANAWVFEVIRYIGAAYLLYLAYKSLRSAIRNAPVAQYYTKRRGWALFSKGYLLHITNPKAILSWGSIYAIGLPADAPMSQIWQLFGMLSICSMIVFFGYAILFSIPRVSAVYRAGKRWFEFAFAALFGAASLKILTARVQ